MAFLLLALLPYLATSTASSTDNDIRNFTIVNGQIYTPGLAIIDAPQPYTPLGGDTLQVAIDVSGDGKLSINTSTDDAPTLFHNITVFLTSYTLNHNFTISNGTTPVNSTSSSSSSSSTDNSSNNTSAYVGPVLSLEPSSTVKHINWIWPECFATNSSQHGQYNISIHQSFRWDGKDYYTVFDLPISVTNSIPTENGRRIECEVLQNDVLSQSVINGSTSMSFTQSPWVNASSSNTSNATTGASEAGGGATRMSVYSLLAACIVNVVLGMI